MEKLKIKWDELASASQLTPEQSQKLWSEIVEAYSGGKRHYHNLHHLAYMLKLADRYRDDIKDWQTLLFSIFYHDIVYNVKKQDNEEQSAELAADRLKDMGLPIELIQKCKGQIIATKAHNRHEDPDTNYLVDIDLAILGDDWETYKEYTQKIRKEYSIYPGFLYRLGRKKVLKHFLDMDRIFKTDKVYTECEHSARLNLKRELEELL